MSNVLAPKKLSTKAATLLDYSKLKSCINELSIKYMGREPDQVTHYDSRTVLKWKTPKGIEVDLREFIDELNRLGAPTEQKEGTLCKERTVNLDVKNLVTHLRFINSRAFTLFKR